MYVLCLRTREPGSGMLGWLMNYREDSGRQAGTLGRKGRCNRLPLAFTLCTVELALTIYLSGQGKRQVPWALLPRPSLNAQNSIPTAF